YHCIFLVVDKITTTVFSFIKRSPFFCTNIYWKKIPKLPYLIHFIGSIKCGAHQRYPPIYSILFYRKNSRILFYGRKGSWLTNWTGSGSYCKSFLPTSYRNFP